MREYRSTLGETAPDAVRSWKDPVSPVGAGSAASMVVKVCLFWEGSRHGLEKYAEQIC